MEAIVIHNDHEIEELLYSSISQLERDMMMAGTQNDQDLLRENRALRGSIQQLKGILKEKLEGALQKNKAELTLMFDEYSTMIKKLLEDKERLTLQLEDYKGRCREEREARASSEAEHENRIRLIVEENSAQISSTKQQIEEFLDIISQYEEEAAQEKEELDRLRERVIELEMDNDKLRRDAESPDSSSSSAEDFRSEDREIERYAQKIENLLAIVDKLQEENVELNHFLKSCQCSKIRRKEPSQESLEGGGSVEETMRRCERRVMDCEKEFIREEMLLREAMRRKDMCIDRLNLVIEEMRKGRYESVDRITEQAIARQPQ
jgi:chromosome segregation ATPase